MLSDIYETVVDIIDEVYGHSQDEHLEEFKTKHFNLDIELCSLISTFIEVTSLKGDFETGAFKEM